MNECKDSSYVLPSRRSLVVASFETEIGKTVCDEEFFEIAEFELWTNSLLATSSGAFPLAHAKNWCGALLDIGIGDEHWFLFVRYENYPYSGFVLKSPLEEKTDDEVYFCQLESVARENLIPRASALLCVEEWFTRGSIEVVPRVLL